MRLVYLMLGLVIISFFSVYYLDYWRNDLKMVPLVGLSSRPSAASNETTPEDTSCQSFSSRFGTSAEEFVQFINNEPDSAQVMQGYRYVFGEVTSPLPGDNLPLFITFDENGKIIAFECTKPQLDFDSSKDIEFTIPENDFIQIVRFKESLEAEQAPTYLQNVTTNPPEAKQIILERIQALN